MAEIPLEVVSKILEPMAKSFRFWRTYKGKTVRIVVDSSLRPCDSVSYLDLKRIFIGKAIEIVDFPSSIVLEDGEEITSQTQVFTSRYHPSISRPTHTDENRTKFTKRAISLNSIKSIEVLEE